MSKISTVERPLEARGIVLRRGSDTWAVVALDYQGLCNASDDLFRQRLAVDPVDIGPRQHDELPAEVVLEVGDNEAIDVSTLYVSRVVAERRESDAARIPYRWYDAAIPYDFPEFQDSVSRTAGELRPRQRERGGYYLNAIGDGRKGRLVWMHTQVGNEPTWYVIEAELLARGAVSPHLPPQGWVGDGQARCAETATQAVQSDQLWIDVADWDGDGLVDLIVGDDFGHLVWWPNLGTKQLPRYEYTRLIFDADGQPTDVGIAAAPKLCDWDNDGDFDLVIAVRNHLLLLENVGTRTEPRFERPPITILPIHGPAPVYADQLLDWNGDGRIDLVSGFTVRLNDGGVNPWSWSNTVRVLPPGVVIEHRSGRGDEEHSTRLDVIAGSANGRVQVFLNSARDDASRPDDAAQPFAAGFAPELPSIIQPRVLLGDLNGDGDDDLYFPSTQGSCFVERSFLTHGYARGVIVH